MAERASDSPRGGHAFRGETRKAVSRNLSRESLADKKFGGSTFTVLSLENATFSSAADLPGLIWRPLRSHVTPRTGKPDTRQVNLAGEPTSARR